MDKKRKELMRGTLEEIVRGLNSTGGADELVRSSRKLKNELIGNLEKKRAFLEAGHLPFILGLINANIVAQAKQNLIHVIGSIGLEDALAIDDQCARAAAVTLISVMSTPDSSSEDLLLPATKSLINLLKHSNISLIDFSLRDDQAALLTKLFIHVLSTSATQPELAGPLAEALCRMCCSSLLLRQSLLAIGQSDQPHLGALLYSLLQSPHMTALLGGLQAVVSLCEADSSAGDVLLCSESPSTKSELLARLEMLMGSTQLAIRMLAAWATVLLKRSSLFALPTGRRELWMHALHVLVKLIRANDAAVAERVPLVLASLVERDSEVERAAVTEADAVTPLALLFSGNPPSISDRAAEGALRAFAAMCAQAEDSRKAVAANSCVIAFLSNTSGAVTSVSPAVRMAALLCLRGLSRSQKPIRSILADTGFLSALLRTLTSPQSQTAQLLALATLSNLVLDFAPMKRSFIDLGFLPVLVRLADVPTLLAQVLWVLKNALMHCDAPVRIQIVNGVTFTRLQTWLEIQNAEVAAQAFGILRNLLHSDAEGTVAQLTCPLLSRVLSLRLTTNTPPEVLIQALYSVCNLANGPAAQKNVILESLPVLVGLMNALEHPSADIRAAVTWAIYNLSQVGRGEPDARAITRLKELKFHTRLQLLRAKDTSLEVLDRISSLRWVTAVPGDE